MHESTKISERSKLKSCKKFGHKRNRTPGQLHSGKIQKKFFGHLIYPRTAQPDRQSHIVTVQIWEAVSHPDKACKGERDDVTSSQFANFATHRDFGGKKTWSMLISGSGNHLSNLVGIEQEESEKFEFE